MANRCIKFEVSCFSYSGDILGGTKNLNGSPDHNDALSGTICCQWAKINLQANFEVYVHPLRWYKRRRKMQKFWWFGG